MRADAYWHDADDNPKPLVALGRARCHRCPLPVDHVPVDKVWLQPLHEGTARAFVCPYCRTHVRERVPDDEALRLFAAGVSRHSSRRLGGRPLDDDDLIDLARELAATDDVVGRALDDPHA